MATRVASRLSARAAPSSPHPAPATPSPTRMAKPSTVFGALAPWSSATPAPITGTESPTKSAISSSDGHRHAVLGSRPVEHEPGRPLEDGARARADQAPLTRNSARLGVERRTAVTSSTRPTSIEIVPSANTRDARSLAVASCDTHPRGEHDEQRRAGQCVRGAVEGGGEEQPGQPGEQPVRREGGKGRRACRHGKPDLTNGARTLGRRRHWPSRARRRGRPARPLRARSRRGRAASAAWLAHAARQPATSGPMPSAPTFTDVPIVRATDRRGVRIRTDTQLDQVGDGRAGGQPDRHAGDQAPDQQTRQRLPCRELAARPRSSSRPRRASRLGVRCARR